MEWQRFLGLDLKSTTNKSKSDKYDFIEVKSFWTVKETIKGVNRQPREWQKIFAGYVSDKNLITRKYLELTQFNGEKPNIQFKNEHKI